MSRSTSSGSISLLVFALVTCVASAFSQQLSADKSPSFRNTSINSAEAKPSDPTAGSLTGRVFNDAEQTDNPSGIAGARVVLRSATAAAGIVSNQISDAKGSYTFSNLPPGKYSIEIDPVSVPAKFRSPTRVLPLEVQASSRSNFDLPLSAQRAITGIVFIDKDGDGQFQAGKDEPVVGALVEAGGILAVSGENGRYVLRDLPAGRLGVLVAWPGSSESTHVVLDLGTGPVTNRVINIPRNR